MAGQLGISLGSQGESAQFYANLLSTRRILDELLSVRFPNARGDSATLLAILHVKGDSASLRMENGAKTLRKRMAVSVDRPTSVVSVAFSMPTAVLAAAVANTAVDLLNRYNQETRQSQAKDQRIFVQGRVTDASHLLHAAEDSLREFHDANRQWQDSPRLQLEEARLQRGVSLRQQVLVSLVQELETAKIAEANDVPVITLVDPAITPSRKSWPRRVIIVLGSWLLCEIGVALVVVIREYRIYFVESDPEGVAALRAVWRRRSQPIRGNESGRGRESPL